MTQAAAAEGPGFNGVGPAQRAAEAAGTSSGVRVRAVEEMDDLREVARLFADVWGRSAEGVPIPSEMLRSLVHADGLVSAAYDLGTGDLAGAAVLGRGVPGASYSYIAAAAPGVGDRGIGFTLKQHQRAWCLARAITTMQWTFDPLVSRNARFNLSKLGARVRTYERSFYGQMSDELNGQDEADRLVADWRLDAPAAVAAADRTLAESSEPSAHAEALASGPDGAPSLVSDGSSRWCRVPADIVSLRRTDPEAASAWRMGVRGALTAAFAEGFVAIGASRTGWYHLSNSEETVA
ncbi:MAG: hypothetical protein V9G04_06705 [Nocardioides sp.]